MDLAIIIVSYNTKSDLENCLRSLHDHPPRVVARDCRRRQRVARWQRRRRARRSGPASESSRSRPNVGFARGQQRGIRQTAERTDAAAQQRHHRAGRRHRRLVAALRELPGASVAGPKIVDANGHRRALVRPDDDAARRAAAETARALRVASSSFDDDVRRPGRSTGSTAPACSCGGAMPKRPACSTSAISCIARMWISAQPSAPTAARSISPRWPRSSTSAAGRGAPAPGDRRTLPPQPAGVLPRSTTLAGRRF